MLKHQRHCQTSLTHLGGGALSLFSWKVDVTLALLSDFVYGLCLLLSIICNVIFYFWFWFPHIKVFKAWLSWACSFSHQEIIMKHHEHGSFSKKRKQLLPKTVWLQGRHKCTYFLMKPFETCHTNQQYSEDCNMLERDVTRSKPFSCQHVYI